MGAEGSMKYVVDKLSETERVFGAENWTNYALENLRETERDMGPGDWFNCVLEKLKQFLYVVQHLGEIIMRKVDEVFPPETREEQIKHWVQVATPYVITAVVLLILFCCCRGVLLMLIRSCCSCVQMVFRSCCRFVQMLIRFCRRLLCCGGGTVVRNGVKMMKDGLPLLLPLCSDAHPLLPPPALLRRRDGCQEWGQNDESFWDWGGFLDSLGSL